MILEGFEIENWSCIRKMRVSGLPPSGVIVLHGPNRTGKSSIVQALRACLMDKSSKTAALKSWYPRGTGEKPIVTVTFQSGGASYRIRKHFGTDRSELARKTSTGDWRVETTSAAEAHERTCVLAGGDNSFKGLSQLLWPPQAEFHLPQDRDFDPSIQAQLRSILGVLQTPLDDLFIERVRNRWSAWYSGQRKAGQQREKSSSGLAENLKMLSTRRQELNAIESRCKEMEGLIREAADLAHANLELSRQLGEQTCELNRRQEEQKRSQARIAARAQAEKDQVAAAREHNAALEEKRQREAVAQRCLDEERAIEPARQQAEAVGQQFRESEVKRDQQRHTIRVLRDQQRDAQERTSRVAAKLRALGGADQLKSAQADLDRVRAVAESVAAMEKHLAEHPAPDRKSLDALKDNRQIAARLEAARDAASMHLAWTPESGGSAAQLAVDGGPLRELPASAGAGAHHVRRKAELHIAGSGRMTLSRGMGQDDLDQIEEDLRRCQEDFARAVTPFGIAGSDPRALDQLIEREAGQRIQGSELDNLRKQLKQFAPQGLEPLHNKVVALQAQLQDALARGPAEGEALPAEPTELDALAASLQQHLLAQEIEIKRLESADAQAEKRLQAERKGELAAKEELAERKTKARASREELDRLRTEQQITERVQQAERALEASQAQLLDTELTSDERTIDERLKEAQEAAGALQSQIGENTRKHDVIKGRLLESEGLHAQRASLAARVDELTRITAREMLERDAVDRLYALFEDCREKQLGTLMGPIHDRVLGWMRVLDIGDYQQVRFSDAFLPEKLLTRDGTAEFSLQEESTGAQEQIGMLTRLALGSILAAPGQPAVAILDDPLTHCDQARLHKMRLILRRAAEGDPSLNPPAGPLQIVILTCHPEWFRDERATVIDLESPEVMSRLDV